MRTVATIAGALSNSKKRKVFEEVLKQPEITDWSEGAKLEVTMGGDEYVAILAFAKLGHSYMLNVMEDDPLACENMPEDEEPEPIDTSKRGYEFL